MSTEERGHTSAERRTLGVEECRLRKGDTLLQEEGLWGLRNNYKVRGTHLCRKKDFGVEECPQ
jgi:hypothetical protein